MKVIFLDVDGVLAHAGLKTAYAPCRHYAQLDPACVDRLLAVVAATGARVVVSSTWRLYSDHMAALTKMLVRRGARRDLIIGTTSRHDLRSDSGVPLPSRGAEIREWMDAHDVESFVVLDDDWVETARLVHIPGGWNHGGMQDAHRDLAIHFLNTTEKP